MATKIGMRWQLGGTFAEEAKGEVRRALATHRGDLTATAAALEVSLRTLERLLSSMGLRDEARKAREAKEIDPSVA